MNEIVFQDETYRIVRHPEPIYNPSPSDAPSYSVEKVDYDSMGKPIWMYLGTLKTNGFSDRNGPIASGECPTNVRLGLYRLLDSLPAQNKEEA